MTAADPHQEHLDNLQKGFDAYSRAQADLVKRNIPVHPFVFVAFVDPLDDDELYRCTVCGLDLSAVVHHSTVRGGAVVS